MDARSSAGHVNASHRRPGRAWLDVPYADKDDAKAHGARWDPQAKRWYDPHPPTSGLQQWAARPDVPDLLPGEDRTFGTGLFVDLVPSTCWFTNVRTCVSPQDWERLRRMIVRRANNACEACGASEGRAARRWLEAHERWFYDEHAGVQTLRRLICLCSPCHLVTHFGRATVTGRAEEAFTHLHAVTGMTHQQANDHVTAAGQLWTARSQRVWELDLTMLTDAGITLRQPERATDRPAAAARGLERELARPAEPIPDQRPTPPEPPQPPAPQVITPPRPARPTTEPVPAPAPHRSFWARITGRE